MLNNKFFYTPGGRGPAPLKLDSGHGTADF